MLNLSALGVPEVTLEGPISLKDGKAGTSQSLKVARSRHFTKLAAGLRSRSQMFPLHAMRYSLLSESKCVSETT